MEEKTNFRSTAFDAACQTILIEQPEAIGVAFKFLDCGCSLLCGVSAQGEGKKAANLFYVQKRQWLRARYLGRDSLAR
jgi:hypothetical protein